MRGAWPKILLTSASIGSLLICALLMALWIRSFFISDAYVSSVDPSLVAYQSHRGALHYVHVGPSRLSTSDRKHPPQGYSSGPAEHAMLWQEWNGPRQDSYTFLGFAYANSFDNFTIAAVPYWLMVALSAILPVWSLPRVLRWIRRPTVQCPNCGARTRKITERCPQCGHALLATGPPPPPIHNAPPPPRPSKRVQSVVVKTAVKPDHSHSPPTDGSDKSA